MDRIKDRWMWLVLPVMVVALYWDFIVSPDDRILGPSERIFYFHMGAATVAAAAFTITAIASAGYLMTHKPGWDIWAAAAAEIGTIFTTMLLISGVLWGRAAWGVWWTWDPRLTATAILWILFLGYLLIREWSEGRERRARYSAVLAIIAYIDVPIDYMTIRWWKSIHPVVLTSHGINMAPSMAVAMLISIAALSLVFIAWMAIRMRLMRAELNVQDLKNAIRAQIER